MLRVERQTLRALPDSGRSSSRSEHSSRHWRNWMSGSALPCWAVWPTSHRNCSATALGRLFWCCEAVVVAPVRRLTRVGGAGLVSQPGTTSRRTLIRMRPLVFL